MTTAKLPERLDAARQKILGSLLSANEITAIINDIARFRYSDMEIAAFLIASASFVTMAELLALTRAMAEIGDIEPEALSREIIPAMA